MTRRPHEGAQDARDLPGRLFVYSGGFLSRRLRRILTLAGWRVTTGWPRPHDHVGVWGASPRAARGEAVAVRSGASLVRIEDAFLRSIRTGRDGAPPLGLLIDRRGVHFDPARPSELEHLLATHPLDDTALLDRARDAIVRMREAHLSKYNSHDPDLPVPDPGYVLVVDQTRDDASVRASGAGPDRFREMLAVARIEHPGARIYIKTHPETLAGHRPGYFGPEHTGDGTELFAAYASPWALTDGAIAVYTVSSQLGFEAILAGHRPRVFGQPFYSGWGLTQDDAPVPRRERQITRAQLAAAALILAPTWYDPCRDRLCEIEDVLDHLEARTRAFRADRRGYVATGMRLWKRGPLQDFFGREEPVVFVDPPEAAAAAAGARGVPLLAWASTVTDELRRITDPADTPLLSVEDGFLRSKGLGAELTPPLSLAVDDLGIYYDPRRESRLERCVFDAAAQPPERLRRAERLVARLIASGVTKYNVGTAELAALPEGHRILVPGQVEDDASIRLGCTGGARTNLALLAATRAQHPEAILLYKPHPDVEAGLRPGRIPDADLAGLADAVLSGTDAAAALSVADEVWTLTSLLGFEALLRGIPVTCLGAPFYAGWGLTTDRAPVPDRRRIGPVSVVALAEAALIAYPRYRDPVSGLACPPEVIVERLAEGTPQRRGPFNRLLARAQGRWASHAALWR
ncbi:MAG: capsular polysaccharide biosynthesis protein [Pseudomonadota bacterium]